MKILWIFVLLLSAAFGMFHIVETNTGFTFVPKASFTFVDTFISVDDVIERYNNRSFAEALRGSSELDNLVRNLKKQGFIVTTKKSDPESESSNNSGTSSQALPQTSQSRQEDNLHKYLFQPSTEVLNDLTVQEKFKALLENEYDRFYKNLSDASALEFNSKFYLGSGCATNSCGLEESAFAIDRETGEVFASIFSDGKTISSFGGSSERSLPAFLYDWNKQHGAVESPTEVAIGKTPIQKPSFNCSKARSRAEILICTDTEFSRLDNELAALYEQAKSVTQDKAAFKKTNQNEWRRREKTCTDRDCLLAWYANRRKQLNEIIRVKDAPKSIQ